MSRYDNLREYKREMGITAKLRRRPKQRITEEQRELCRKCGRTRYEHECAILIPDHPFAAQAESDWSQDANRQ